MASISAKFKLIDEMSAKLDKIAQSGRSALSQWEQAGNAIDMAFDGAATETAQTAQSINTSTDAVEKFSEATTRAADKADEFATAMDEMENATNASAAASENLSSASDETEEALKGVEESSERAKKKVKEYGEENEDAGKKSKKFGQETTEAIQSIEDLLITVGITKLLKSIGDAFINCVGDAIEFESAITGVYKTVDGMPEQLQQISDEVKELATRIPATTTEIAAVAEAAGQLGIATENVMAFSEVMINLGEATNLTSNEAASALAKFTNITGTAASEYENLGSTIVALGNNFATTEADIVAMSTRMASAGTLAGMTESDILALAASLSSVGIEADAGGSSMSTLISKMQLSVETGNDKLEQFASVAGYTADEFAQKWGEDAAGALYAFIDGLNDTERNGASATAILDEMGITEIRLSNAIKALSNNSESLGDALNFASVEWNENTALATEAGTRYATLESKLSMTKNAANNLSIAVGDTFIPTISAAAGVGKSILNGLTTFTKNNPTVVKGIAALAVGVGTFTAAIVAYSVATKAAKVAQAALNAIQLANPYYLVGAAIAAVTAGIVSFIASVTTVTEKEEELSYVTQVQKDKLDSLGKEYDEVCDKFGETSYQAQELKLQIDELSNAYEKNKLTSEEWEAQFEEAMNSYQEFADKRQTSIEATELENKKIISLVNRLVSLSEQTSITAAEQQEMLTIVNALNRQIPELALSYDQYTNSLSLTADAIIAIAERAVNQNKYDELEKQLEDSIRKKTELTNAYADAEEQYQATLVKRAEAQEYLNSLEGEHKQMFEESKSVMDEVSGRNYAAKWQLFARQYGEASDALSKMNDEVEKAKDRMKQAQGAIDDNENAIKIISEEMAELTGTITESSDKFYTYKQAVDSCLSSVNSEIAELCQQYDKAYEAARESIDGQIGLFDEITLEVEQTTNQMLGAWESQINYLTSYSENIKKAMDFGLDEALVKELSNGSQESAAQLDTIISKVEELGGTTEQAKEFVDGFNSKFQEVEKAKNEFAEQVADIETDFSDSMKAIEDRLMDSIDKMNMESDAKEAAKATMSGYISEIIAGGDSAALAAENAAARVREKLQSGTAKTATSNSDKPQTRLDSMYEKFWASKENFRIGSEDKYKTYEGYLDATYEKYGGYAEGTDYATAGIKLVGENGPEIVEFAGGEKVYTADETEDIFTRTAEAVRSNSISSTVGDTQKSHSGGNEPKVIRLEINGEGAIEVDENVDEATVVAILQQHLKPVLTNIVKQEIYEEGDLSYDF